MKKSIKNPETGCASILERLKLKAKSSYNDKVRMPSIKEIKKLLDAYGITSYVDEHTNVVEYRSKGKRYVNSRHMGKTGLRLKIPDANITLDTSSSYYSYNTWSYAEEIVKLIEAASLVQNGLLAEVKLTKSALNDFIKWSTCRYSNYCSYGTKKENVDIVYNSLIAGCYVDWRGRLDVTKKVFTIQCAGGVGQNGNDDEYTVNCETMTIEAKYSKRAIKFSS